LKGNELAFYCPFCNHHKPKLQVNTETQKWHCWTCNSGGKKLTSLLRKLDVDRKTISIIREIYGDSNYNPQTEDADTKVFIQLPKEFISLAEEPKGFNPEYKHAMFYLSQRGIGTKEIVKYNIGYCKDGLYSRRIIIPSYSLEGSLNYFVSRSYYVDEKMKYKNPPISKNVICFDSQINWNEPITIVEGVFDAISVKRNVIPILGKFIPKKLMENIYNKGVKTINILLDNDAQEQALHYVVQLGNQGIKVRNIIPSDKDASEMGFSKVNQILKESKETNFDDVIKQKLFNL
jgi:DNA primase